MGSAHIETAFDSPSTSQPFKGAASRVAVKAFHLWFEGVLGVNRATLSPLYT